MAAPAMPVGEEFQPEAAIVNYFGSGITIFALSMMCQLQTEKYIQTLYFTSGSDYSISHNHLQIMHPNTP